MGVVCSSAKQALKVEPSIIMVPKIQEGLFELPFDKCEVNKLQHQWSVFMKSVDMNGFKVFKRYAFG